MINYHQGVMMKQTDEVLGAKIVVREGQGPKVWVTLNSSALLRQLGMSVE